MAIMYTRSYSVMTRDRSTAESISPLLANNHAWTHHVMNLGNCIHFPNLKFISVAMTIILAVMNTGCISD